MNHPLISICVMMSRPGGVDITFAALADQTFRDFELIVVDHRYERRRESMAAMANEYGIERFIHAPEHRRNGKWIVAATGYNTALALARGRIVLILHDYTYVGPGWIESHLAALEGHPGRYVAQDHKNVDLPAVVTRDGHPLTESLATDRDCLEVDESFRGDHLDELCIFERGRFNASWLPLPASSRQWPTGLTEEWHNGRKPEHGWITLTNDSAHRDLLWRLNGIDERFDLGRGPFDANLGTRIENSGGETYWLPEPIAMLLNPRFLMRSLPYGSHGTPPPGRWNARQQRDYYNIVRYTKPVRARAANPYDIEQLARQLEPWRRPDVEKVPLDVPDIAYWRQVIDPGTPPLYLVDVTHKDQE